MKNLRNPVMLIMTICFIFGMTACGNAADKQPAEPVMPETESREPDLPETESRESDLPETESREFDLPETGSRELDLSAAEESQPLESTSLNAGTDVLVAYFSATGTTREVAEKIAVITDADLYEILPADAYAAEDLNYNDDQSRTSIEMNDPDARPEIGSESISLADYSTLYIGYPIWWGSAPRIMNTFVESYDFDGITVIPFCTSGSSDIGSSAEQLAEQTQSGIWTAGRRFSGNVSEADLQDWIESLQ